MISSLGENGQRWTGRLLVGLVALVAPLAAAPAVANAATPCSEQVCLFDDNGRFVGAYAEVTDYFQEFETTRTASAVNGFQNEAVYFVYANGATSCIQPKREASVSISDYGPATGLMIRPDGNCYPGGEIQ